MMLSSPFHSDFNTLSHGNDLQDIITLHIHIMKWTELKEQFLKKYSVFQDEITPDHLMEKGLDRKQPMKTTDASR